MKIKRNQVIIAVVVAIVGFLLINRFMQKPKAAPAAPAALVVAAELKDMKYQIINSSKTEMYRSGDSTAHTIAGTILEQAIDIIVAVLEQPQVVEVGNSIIASKEDADNVATMIEEVGKDVAKNIKDVPADKFLSDGPQSAYTTLKRSLKDEVDKTDIWFPIAQRYAAAHGSKAPFNMDDNQKNKVKNASAGEINSARDAMKQLIDAGFGRSGGGNAQGTAPSMAYDQSCDDLGGGVLVRMDSGVPLDDCKKECATMDNCKGFIYQSETGFCQLHDNKEITGVDVCDKGYKMYRK